MAFEIEGEASNYELYVNNNLEQEEQVKSTNTFTKEFENAGTQDIRIEAYESGELQETLQRSFETSAPPEASINWINPTGSVDTTTPELEYEIDAGTDYSYELYLNSQLVDTGEASGINTHTFTPDPLPQGTHSYEVKVFDDNEREIGNTSETFETTAERKLVEGDFSYRYSSEVNQHQILMDMEAYAEPIVWDDSTLMENYAEVYARSSYIGEFPAEFKPDLSQTYTETSNLSTNYGDGLAFSSDGSKMFVSRYDGVVEGYSLSSPWDLSSASSTGNSVSTDYGFGLAFSGDGSKMFVSDNGGVVEGYER